MAENTSVRLDPSGNMRPDKGRSQDKIDGTVALIMALGAALEQPAKTAGFCFTV